MKRVVFYSFVLAMMCGCSLQTTVAANTQYRFEAAPQMQNYSSRACRNDLLQLKNINAYEPMTNRSIYYQVGDLKLASYSESNWEEAPFKTVELSFIRSIRDTKIFKDVLLSRSAAKPDFILEYSIEEFMQHFDENMRSSYATVKIHFALLENKNSRLLYSTTIEKRVPSSALNALGGVKALQLALSDVMWQTNIWLDTQCQKEPEL